MQKSCIIGMLFCLAIGIFIGILIHSTTYQPAPRTEVKTHDTLIVYKHSPVLIDSARPKIKYITRLKNVYIDSIQYYIDSVFIPNYIYDTMLLTKPFIASLDTIILNDTIRFKYFYPSNLSWFYFGRKNDSIKFTWIDSINYVSQNRTFWDQLKDGALWFLGGAAFGTATTVILKQ